MIRFCYYHIFVHVPVLVLSRYDDAHILSSQTTEFVKHVTQSVVYVETFYALCASDNVAHPAATFVIVGSYHKIDRRV